MHRFDDITEELLALRPKLRVFALSLARQADQAEDLVQDTLVMALSKAHQYQRGTNLSAWTCTILRNAFLDRCRRNSREVQDVDGAFAAELSSPASQDDTLDFQDMAKAFRNLGGDQQQALLLVAVEGLTFEEVAALQGTAIGTAKSRVIRARAALTRMLAETPSVPTPLLATRPERMAIH